ncbi:ABC transporter substrate-binding protein [Dictyobacter arantiisoli]|uniref:Putative ABC transporter-binding protein n=1 Tax=Dictyobacter arantiisoli TaxID=2014874 RepID=A0A5A5TH74_9CHLR|nr:ABC transporter substrate-binding protein [Dictyobacter arantiisoli]GCF10314.1 putative ABC transporter-binding protein [Dictyobacter arantiisoli]
MLAEEREALDEIVSRIRAGRITRRTFLERALALGLTGSSAVSLLEACGGSSNSSGGNGASINLVWQSEQESTQTYQHLADRFNQSIGQQQGIHVTWLQGPANSDDMLAKYNNMLRARDSSIDVLSIDIVYPAQFADSQWIKPLSERRWPASERAKYLTAPLLGCTYQGKIWAAPLRTDVGLLYYRTDLVPRPPQSWDELTASARNAMAKTRYGYVWQGAQYEGLVCNFCEVLYGYGGAILAANNPRQVTVNSSEGRAALTKMVSWVGSISPAAVTSYLEDSSRQVWQNGSAAYMRNWPYAYAMSKDAAQSQVDNRFAIHSIPYGGTNTVGHSAIGGWNLAINAFSQRQEQAWQFIHYMLQPPAQKTLALTAGLAVTLLSTYDDPEVLQKGPLFALLKPVLQQALPRPVSPRYSNVSDAIQRHVYQALKQQSRPSDALRGLEDELKQINSTIE